MSIVTLIGCSSTEDRLSIVDQGGLSPDDVSTVTPTPADFDQTVTSDDPTFATTSEAPRSDLLETDNAIIDTVEALILESFPVQINIVVQGAFPDGCTELGEVTQLRNGTEFVIQLKTLTAQNQACTEALVPFEHIESLEVEGLPAGSYQVLVNDKTAEFELSMDNELSEEMDQTDEATDSNTGSEADEALFDNVESYEPQLNTLTTIITESFPVEVSVVVNGSLTDGCSRLLPAIPVFETTTNGGRFIINLEAERSLDMMCTQQIVAFEEIIPLPVEGLPAGTYQVAVNGLNTDFELLTDNAVPDEPLIPVDETPSSSDSNETTPSSSDPWTRLELLTAGLSFELPSTSQQIESENRWTVDGQSTSYLGLQWQSTGTNWNPTDMLPSGSQITGRLATDTNLGEGLLYQVALSGTVTTVEIHLIVPLDGDIAYDFYAGADQLETLGQIQSLHDRFAQSAVELELSPCTPRTDMQQLFTAPSNDYCFVYPNSFAVQPSNRSSVFLEGPLNPAEIPATLQIIRQPAQVNSLDEVVQEQLRGLPGNFIVQETSLSLDNEPAVIIEGFPGRVATRHLFVLHQGMQYQFIVSPLDAEAPANQADVDQLWDILINSFAFLD
ncbi:hypothetical protein QUF64_15485 [Anaerolineales bacterium HSG6]|nr:hypothetical protein [Anaerolineales bacterium HSG6]MDM8530875.1 hypothetical protein [Anaerolineales bacterium HSG25]